MGHLDRLRKSIESMTLEELREHVRQVRADRRISKAGPRKEAKTRVRRSDTSKTKAKKALDKMTPEQMEALLRELEGDAGTGDQA
jgi:hypothetical protein